VVEQIWIWGKRSGGGGLGLLIEKAESLEFREEMISGTISLLASSLFFTTKSQQICLKMGKL
jgi:hypothetical protein